MSVNVHVDDELKILAESSDVKLVAKEIENISPTSVNFRKPFDIYMHQGLSSNAKHIPSNSVPALLEALNAGFDGMETDCRKTSDGVWVLAHDPSITGTVDGVSTTMTIASSTLSQLKTVLLGSSEEYGDTYIATLQEALQICSYTGMKMILEYKGGTDPQEIAEIVMITGAQDRVTYMCTPNYWEQIAAIDRHASFADVIFGFGTVTDFSPYIPFLTESNTVSLDYQANADNPNMENIVLAQKAGLSIDYWNVTENNHTLCFNTNPKRITVNGAEVFDYLDDYLKSKENEVRMN